MKKIAIISPGTLPLPPVQGGAVESLIELLRKQNEGAANTKLVLFSIYTAEAQREAQKTPNTDYYFIKIPFLVQKMDKLVFKFAQKVLHKQNARSFRYLFQRLYYIYQTARQLKQNNYARVILENHTSLLLVLKLFGNYHKYQGHYYYHMHNRITDLYFCSTIFKHSAAIIGVSSYILSTLPEEFNQTPRVVLKNRVDTVSFCRPFSKKTLVSIRKKFNLGNKKVVVFSGRISYEKGIQQLLKAWQKLKLSNAILLIVGNSFFKSDVQTEFEKQMMRITQGMDNIRFTGFIDYKLMPMIYHLADLVVLPSIWDDPAPLTVVETLTVGRPLITTNAGGIPEYADSNTTILKRNSYLVDNLASAIQQKLQSKNMINKKDKSNWSPDKYYQQMMEILKV